MTVRVLIGDNRDRLAEIADGSIHCCVTSPPYFGLRDYGVAGQIGLEASPAEYVAELVTVFREVRRALRDDGTLWLNLGDSYAANRGYQVSQTKHLVHDYGASNASRVPQGLKPKDLIGIPWRVAFALQADGWYLRSSIIWHKPNPMPESVTDRPTSAHENIFLLAKSERYYFDAEAVAEVATNWGPRDRAGKYESGETGLSPHRGLNGSSERESRNIRNVWTVATQPFSEWTDSVALVPVPISEVQALAASGNASGGDTARITSPNCPMHAGLPDLLPKGFCDGLSADQLNCMRGNDSRLGLGTPDGCASIPQSQVPAQARPSKTNCSDLVDSETATQRNKRSRKTGLDLGSCSHATLFEGTSADTQHTQPSEEAPASICRGTAENRTAVDTSASSSALGTVAHNTCKSESENSVSCQCGYYRKVVAKTSHFATFPPALIEPCIKAGCPLGGTVLDPFGGAGTTGLVADRLGRSAVLIELNPSYASMAASRIRRDAGMFAEVAAQ